VPHSLQEFIMVEHQFIGIDVSKDKFDVCLLQEEGCILQKIFNNTGADFKKFKEWITAQCENPWVCMEATGHYSEIIADFLASCNIKVSVVNPVQIKYLLK
jgi:transposase